MTPGAAVALLIAQERDLLRPAARGDRERVAAWTSFWRRENDGRWRMVFHQGTPDTGAGTI